jgi:hypothetical protein
MRLDQEGRRNRRSLKPLASPRLRFAVIALLIFLLTPVALLAGPPFVTDDPEPVELRHFEVYLASVASRDADAWSGTAPQLEVNYGAYPDLQLHLIVPAAFSAPGTGPSHYGLGDVELGAKFRFVHEGDRMPQIGTFPLVELPSGSAAKGLGEGHARILIPLWLQKSWGAWTSYGGVGYWLDTGAGARDSWFLGWQLQRRVSANAVVGAELFHTTASQPGTDAETRVNLGAVIDLSEAHHVLLSVGRGIEGSNRFQAYVGYQLTFGPGKG